MSQAQSTVLLEDIPSAQSSLNVGRTMVYQLVKNGDLVAVKIGRRTLITRASIETYVERLTSLAGDAA